MRGGTRISASGSGRHSTCKVASGSAAACQAAAAAARRQRGEMHGAGARRGRTTQMPVSITHSVMARMWIMAGAGARAEEGQMGEFSRVV